MTCPICKNAEAKKEGESFKEDASKWNCPQCGAFKISRHAEVNLRNINDSHRWKVSAWLVQYSPEMLTANDVDAALGAEPPSIHQRAMQMLRWLSNRYNVGQKFVLAKLGTWKPYEDKPGSSSRFQGGFITNLPIMPVGWCKTVAEMEFLITEVLCNEMKLLQRDDTHQYQISPKGWLTLEGVPNASSQIGFCAMWFGDEVKALWAEAIEPAIRESGYEPLRIDGKQHNGKIDDEIVASIRSSRFVVADYTGSRGGVYYEAGLAHGLGIPVIFMCREDHLKDIHFDVRQYNCIVWKDDELQKARSDLKNRILATLGQGPLQIQ